MSARVGRRRREARAEQPARTADYRILRHWFEPQKVFSDDAAMAIHEAALTVLSDLGVKVLLPEARAMFRAAGALVDDDHMVRIGREIVEGALATCPRSIRVRGGAPERDVVLELGALTFMPGGGVPHADGPAAGSPPWLAQRL